MRLKTSSAAVPISVGESKDRFWHRFDPRLQWASGVFTRGIWVQVAYGVLPWRVRIRLEADSRKYRAFGSKVSPAEAVSGCMDTTNPTATAFRNLVIAADETLHVLCRLRGITIDDLSEEALEAFFFQALDDEFWIGAR
jgi:hypothetical protein